LRILSSVRGQGRAWPSAGGVGYSVESQRTITACVSIGVDTSATFTAKRQSLAAKRRFRSLKGALFCRREGAYRNATVWQPVRFRTFRDYCGPEHWVAWRNPGRASVGFGTLRL